MKILLTISCLFLATRAITQAQGPTEFLVFLTEQDGGHKYEYKIRWKSIHDIPEWNPESEEAPLPLKKAIETARATLLKHSSTYTLVGPDSIHLARIGWNRRDINRWYYKIKFHRESKFPDPFTSVVVLMNGTVIVPTVSKNDSSPKR